MDDIKTLYKKIHGHSFPEEQLLDYIIYSIIWCYAENISIVMDIVDDYPYRFTHLNGFFFLFQENI